jgi:hypothetical protein
VHVCLSSSGAALAVARREVNRTARVLNCIVIVYDLDRSKSLFVGIRKLGEVLGLI